MTDGVNTAAAGRTEYVVYLALKQKFDAVFGGPTGVTPAFCGRKESDPGSSYPLGKDLLDKGFDNDKAAEPRLVESSRSSVKEFSERVQ